MAPQCKLLQWPHIIFIAKVRISQRPPRPCVIRSLHLALGSHYLLLSSSSSCSEHPGLSAVVWTQGSSGFMPLFSLPLSLSLFFNTFPLGPHMAPPPLQIQVLLQVFIKRFAGHYMKRSHIPLQSVPLLIFPQYYYRKHVFTFYLVSSISM